MKSIIPEEVFAVHPRSVEVGNNKLNLFSKTKIEQEQLGYRINGLTREKISDWLGDQFYVIGEDAYLNDPFVADISNKRIPIYTMFHDDWTTKELIAKSLGDFIVILSLLKRSEITDLRKANLLIRNIKKIAPKGCTYYTDLIKNAYETSTNNKWKTLRLAK